MLTVKHMRSEGPWALPLCITPEEAYRQGRAQDPMTIGEAVQMRVAKTTTLDAEQVTCLACLEVMAVGVEESLDICNLHGRPKPRKDCDVCMGRRVWAGLVE